MERKFTDQELVRREKAENIRKMGIDPFGQRFDVTDCAAILKINLRILLMMNLKVEKIMLL